jgi:hypothetical protein
MFNGKNSKIYSLFLIAFMLISIMPPPISASALDADLTALKNLTENAESKNMGAGAVAKYIVGLCYLIGVLLIGYAFVKIAESNQEPDIQKFLKYVAFAILAFMAGKLINFAANPSGT